MSSVQGHKGRLVLGTVAGVKVACLQGRVHLYEGIETIVLRVPIYCLKLIGCEAFLATAAVGSLNPDVSTPPAPPETSAVSLAQATGVDEWTRSQPLTDTVPWGPLGRCRRDCADQ